MGEIQGESPEKTEGEQTMSMTREEAITLLKYRRNIISSLDADWNANEIEAINFALSALRPGSRGQIEQNKRRWEVQTSISPYYYCSECGDIAQITGVWCAFPATELLVTIVGVIFFVMSKKLRKRRVRYE